MRLIDAGKILDELSGMLKIMDDYDAVRKVINNMPTAYDVDAVVEQLEEVKKKNTEIALDDLQKERCFWYKQGMDKAIEIVKGGGKNEQRTETMPVLRR